MTSCRSGARRRWSALGCGFVLALWTIAARAELPEWARNVDAAGRFHDAFFRTLPMPAGPIEVRRAPADTRIALARIPAAAQDREWLAMRARVAEEQLDATAAEADWKAYAAASADAADGQMALADFYHRRLRPQQEADALAAAARAPDSPADRLVPPTERRSWLAFQRLFTLIGVQQLPDAFAEAQYRAWVARFPDQSQPYDRLFDFLVAHDRTADAESLLATYRQSFPVDEAWPLRARAELAIRRGAPADALAVYDQAFRPLWDAELVRSYFDLLDRTHNLRAFLDRARADIAARPADLVPAARIFYYYQRAGNANAAEQTLADFEARQTNAQRTATELLALAQLYEKTRNYDEAIRYEAAAYTLQGASPADIEQALAGIIETLFTVPEQPLRFGSGDLSFYRDIATLDRGPGFLNGVLSLLYNSASPREQYARQEAAATSYFHRVRAADLLTLFETRFPNSTRRTSLNATLISTYAAYGESDAVIERGRRFLAAFPDAPQRSAVSLAMADAFARKEQTAEEFTTYDRLLQELAARADRVPLGMSPAPLQEGGRPRATGARSQEYARVLDRYVSRLVSRKQLPEAFVVYRNEIDRNPDDPGLYAAFAQFLEQNDFSAEVEQVYRRAIQQFPDHSWHHRLARWYLRRKQAAAFTDLTRNVVRAFDGTELARYFDAVVAQGSNISPQLYLQLNLYAVERFPHHLTFVRNLLSAYAVPETSNPAAREALLRRHWFEDDNLTAEFFGMLSRTRRLDAEIALVRRLASATADGSWTQAAKDNPLATRFLAEADIWQSHFESATPPLNALAAEFSGDVGLGHRAGSLHRSLSYADAREVDLAALTEERIRQYVPRDTATLTVLGEIHADREHYDRARPHWDQLPEVEPGSAAGYLETATVYWDYFQFQDALRVIAQGRAKLASPALYAYEAGAIYEGLRQPELAIAEYAAGALTGSGSPPARSRLLTLSRREAYRSLVDRASAAAADVPAPSSTAVSLRIAVLESQDRRADLERFLLTVLDRSTSLELMAEIGSQAARLGLDTVATRSLTRQVAVMTDPVDRLQLRYALVRLYESQSNLGLARSTLEAVYAENPRLLGVVRQTADYYWQHNLRREAIAVLTRAAGASYPSLKKRLTFEAARRSIETAAYAEARELLKPLVADDPFNADYLAATADTYALAKEDGPLRDFYKATIESIRTAPMPADERTRRVAGLRRALIPALARLNDHTGAIDQYIEIINRFPDDDGLLREAGTYARQHGRTEQLVGYYTKTAGESPRDYRWPMLLARLYTQFADFPAAITAYASAIAIRPDRADFQTARGALEERLMRFDDAVSSYTKAYDLTYHNPQWMEKIAELRARQGQVDAAAKALRDALVEGRPARPENMFAVAARLAQWNMLEPARSAADEGARLAGPAGLLETGGTYVSIYTRLRLAEPTVDRLLQARDQARAALAPGADGARIQPALAGRLEELAQIVGREFSPEERTAFGRFLEQKKASLPRSDFEPLLVPVAERAGLSDLAVRWRVELMNASRASQDNSHIYRLIELQTERLRFAELARQLESFAALGGRHASDARNEAAEAYRKAGDPTNELRVLQQLNLEAIQGPHRDRYFELLRERNPQRLVALAGTGPSTIRNAAANYLVAHGTADQALAGVQARSQGEPPVWSKAYTALVGFYFARYDAATADAFRSALGARTIAAGLTPPDRSARLAGDVWFAYGARFGEYLTYAKQPGAEDYLPAEIERTPARSDAYVTLADFHRDLGHDPAALAEYDHAAALNARRSDVHMRAAVILWRQGLRPAAIARWQRAMEVLAAPPARNGNTDTGSIVAVLDSIASRKLLPELRDPADKMVRAYITRNGIYRAGTLLRAAFRAAGDAAAGTDWLVDIARATPDQTGMLGELVGAQWLPDAQRDRVYERLVAFHEGLVGQRYGVARLAAESELDRWRVQRIQFLVNSKQIMRAEELLRALPEPARLSHLAEVMTLEARVAAATQTIDVLLDRFGREENQAAVLEALRNASTALRRAGERAPARRFMEFVYLRQLDREDLTAPVFLGLAEIRLEEGNVPAALDLLRRLTLVAGEPFDNLATSAALLERLKHPAEALEFRRARVLAVPWDQAAQIALARNQLAGTPGVASADIRTEAFARLARVAESPAARYSIRAEAARAFASANGSLGRAPKSEIDWLRAPASLSPSAVDQPLFVDARLAAAERATEPSTRVTLLLAALAADPKHAGLRIPLFRAELAAGKPADALEAVGPLVPRARGLTGLGLGAADRTRLAREMGDAYQQTDQLGQAVQFLRLALEGEPAAARPALNRRIAWLSDEIARRARNATRRPEIGQSLDQDHLVRPLIPPKPAPTLAQGAAR